MTCALRWISTIAISFVIASEAVADDSVLRTIPHVQRLYERRLEDAREGILPPVFTGSASVVPVRAQNFTVSLGLPGFPQERGHFCGGVIIDPHWVLTAAHCTTESEGERSFRTLQPGQIQVLAGSTILYKGGQTKQATRVVIHPDFRTTSRGVPENDLALLQFADPLPGRPILLASDELTRLSTQDGERIGIFGWGTSRFSSESPISTNLLYAFVETVGRAKCNKAYNGAVTDKMFCAGLGNADACQGDSGGPAFTYDDDNRMALVGVTSWGAGCADRQYPGVYVDVAKYRGWINEMLNNHTN